MKFSLTIQLILLPDFLPCDTHTHTHTHTHCEFTDANTTATYMIFSLLYTIFFFMYFQGLIGINSYIMSMYITFCTAKCNAKQINAFVLFLTIIFGLIIYTFSYEFSIMCFPYFTNPRLYIQTYCFQHESLIIKKEFPEILSVVIL
jgi:hypothetical protein